MSIKVMSQVWENETLSATDKIVLLSLADHADDEGICYPSISRLVKRTGLTERTVQNATQRLKQRGFLRVELNAGRRGANLYHINATPAADAPPQQMHPAADTGEPPHLTTQTPAADAPEPSRTVIKTSDQFDAQFDRFWSSWPLRKVGKEKARAAFKRLSQANREQATIRAASWASKWRATYPTASDVHPSTYLNGKRWEDELQQPQSDIPQINRWRKLAGER